MAGRACDHRVGAGRNWDPTKPATVQKSLFRCHMEWSPLRRASEYGRLEVVSVPLVHSTSVNSEASVNGRLNT